MTTAVTAGFVFTPTQLFAINKNKRDKSMYGLIGKITVKAGKREELIKILLEGTTDMPGCLSYIISKDSKDDNAIWVSEVWDSKENHKSSLSLPSVQEAISQGRPLIAEFGEQIETEPVGGHGLASTK
jgi:quinol monooxygenase YgiN